MATEACRNIAGKAEADCLAYLQNLLAQIEINNTHFPANAHAAVQWLPEKDRPVLMAAIARRCDALLTGDRTHFGAGYGQTSDGVTIYTPGQLAMAVFPPR